MSKSDDNAPGPKDSDKDELKPARDSVHYFQEECMNYPCLRCDPYCPYCGSKIEKEK